MPDLVVYQQELATALAAQDYTDAAGVAARIMAAPTPTSDEQAGVLTDAAKVCKKAKEDAEAQLKTVTAPLREAEAAARALARPVIDQLGAAVDAAKKKLGEWNDEKARRAAEEQRERDRIAREEAARVAREQEAARQIAAEGEVPVPEVRPAVVPEATIQNPTQTRGSASVASSRRKPASFAVTDMQAVAKAKPEWLVLEEKLARGEFANEVRRQEIKAFNETGVTPTKEQAEERAIQVFADMGLKVWFESTVAIR